VLYVWGASDLAGASRVIENVPDVNPDMLARVRAELSELGGLATFLGPLTGTPYKVYAIQAAHSGVDLWSFLFISIPARLYRFLIVTILCHYVLKVPGKLGMKTDPLVFLMAGWVIFYLHFFYLRSHCW
jgi:hypothetical protein